MGAIQQKLTELGFTQTHTVCGMARIDALLPEKKRCGIYVLHFPDQTYYVGQAKDVCKRYVQHHSKAFPDIEQISFKPVPQTKLDNEEQYAIHALEASGVRLRNILHTSIPATSSEFDVLMPITDQKRWLDDLSFADAGDARATIPAERYVKTNHKYRLFEQDIPRKTQDEALRLLRYYIHQCIPAYRRTEYDYWSLSCLPVTNGKRLAALNMSKMELLVIFPNGHLFVNVAVSEILKAYPTIADFHRTYPNAYITPSHYEDAGTDQAHIDVGSFAEAWRVFADPAVQHSMRLLNLYRMRKRGSFYKQYHCPALVDAIYAVPVPDVQQQVQPANPAEYQTTDVARLQLSYGQRLIAYEDYESAQVVLERALTTFEKRLPSAKELASSAAFYLGRACQGLGDNPRAIKCHTQSIKYDPNDAAVYVYRGLAYHSQSEYTRAIQDYTRAIQLEPDAVTYNARGLAYYAQGDYARAIEDYTRAIQLDPNYAVAYYNRGDAYYEQGEYARAIQDCTHAIQLEPDAVTYNTRGLAYYAQGDYARAIQDYDQAIALEPKDAGIYTNRGVAYEMQGEYVRAIQDYDQAIALDPEYARAYNNRGVAYARKGEYAQSIKDLNQAIVLEPENARFYNGRSWTYYLKGDYARAIADCTQAINLDPNDPNAYHSRGFAHAAHGNTPAAIADLERFIGMSDDAELIAEAQEKLRELRQ